MKLKYYLTIALITALIGYMGITQVLAAANTKVRICHATGSEKNPYVSIDVNKNGSVDGHNNHSGDIIPPFEYVVNGPHGTQITLHYSGKNWDGKHQAIWDNDCQVVHPSATPTMTPTATPTPTLKPTATPTPTPKVDCDHDGDWHYLGKDDKDCESPTPTPSPSTTPCEPEVGLLAKFAQINPCPTETPSATPTPDQGNGGSGVSDGGSSNPGATQPWHATCNIPFDKPILQGFRALGNGSVEFDFWGVQGVDKYSIIYGYAPDKLVYGQDNIPATSTSVTLNGLQPNASVWAVVSGWKNGCSEDSNELDPIVR